MAHSRSACFCLVGLAVLPLSGSGHQSAVSKLTHSFLEALVSNFHGIEIHGIEFLKAVVFTALKDPAFVGRSCKNRKREHEGTEFA